MDRSIGRLRGVVRSALADDIAGLSAELAYRFLFALFPFMIFLAALGGFVASWLDMENPAGRVIEAIGDELPPDLMATIRPELEAVLGSTNAGLLSFGAIAALWAATGGTNALIKAMNRAYGVEDTRGFVGRYVMAVALTLLAVGGMLASFAVIAGGAALTAELVAPLGIGEVLWTILELLRYPLVLLLLIVAVAVLYRLAPVVRAPWRWAVLGATVFAVGWVVATAAFSIYLANFGSYASTYGAFAGVIVLMLWFYLTALVLLVGAEVVAIMSHDRVTDGAPATEGDTAEAATRRPGIPDRVHPPDAGPIATNAGSRTAEPARTMAGQEGTQSRIPLQPRGSQRPSAGPAPRRTLTAGWPLVVPISLVGVAVAVGAFSGAISGRLLRRDT
jgi:membrane protein